MILFCMFLAALNLVNRYYYCIYIAAILFVLTPRRKVRINKSVFALLAFSVAMLLFNPDSQDTILDMIKPFTFPLCYIVGFGLFQNREQEKIDVIQEEKRIASVIYVLSGGAMVHFLLNAMLNRESEDRNVIDFWTNSQMSATAQAALACLGLAVAITFLFVKTEKRKKYIAVATIFLILLYNLILAGRTLFVLSAILCVVSLLYVRTVEKRKMHKSIIVVAAAACLIIVAYNHNLFGIKGALEETNFYRRFFGGVVTEEIESNARMQHKLAYLKHALDYLWGGGNIRSLYGHSAHDLYLDTYDESGIIALCAIVVYIGFSLGRLVLCLKNNMISLETRLLVFCIYLVCNLYFWMEPIIRGIPWLLASYCFVDGAVAYLLFRLDAQQSWDDASIFQKDRNELA